MYAFLLTIGVTAAGAGLGILLTFLVKRTRLPSIVARTLTGILGAVSAVTIPIAMFVIPGLRFDELYSECSGVSYEELFSECLEQGALPRWLIGTAITAFAISAFVSIRRLRERETTTARDIRRSEISTSFSEEELAVFYPKASRIPGKHPLERLKQGEDPLGTWNTYQLLEAGNIQELYQLHESLEGFVNALRRYAFDYVAGDDFLDAIEYAFVKAGTSVLSDEPLSLIKLIPDDERLRGLESRLKLLLHPNLHSELTDFVQHELERRVERRTQEALKKQRREQEKQSMRDRSRNQTLLKKQRRLREWEQRRLQQLSHWDKRCDVPAIHNAGAYSVFGSGIYQECPKCGGLELEYCYIPHYINENGYEHNNVMFLRCGRCRFKCEV